MLYRADPKI